MPLKSSLNQDNDGNKRQVSAASMWHRGEAFLRPAEKSMSDEKRFASRRDILTSAGHLGIGRFLAPALGAAAFSLPADDERDLLKARPCEQPAVVSNSNESN